jgi:hypothetical protein
MHEMTLFGFQSKLLTIWKVNNKVAVDGQKQDLTLATID